jgi:holo-[acyl-carrier-protein] synthase
VVAHALEVVAIDETRAVATGRDAGSTFSQAEMDYAHSRSDPERRLAARLAAKRAACAALGGDLAPADFEIVPARGGPPRLALSPRAVAQCSRLGGSRVLVSLTHGLTHAAAAVLVVADE